MKLLDPSIEIPDSAVILDDRFGGPIYGVPNDGTKEAMKLAARSEAIITDHVYEGKSMDGMINLIREGTISKGSKVLYVHLGGQPALVRGISIILRALADSRFCRMHTPAMLTSSRRQTSPCDEFSQLS
jgi:1-aminocyclopropane-1-carboxylate deaminase/D-cysteine desulfhydrase-like pyridoxal-dependent ACC family enzyme